MYNRELQNRLMLNFQQFINTLGKTQNGHHFADGIPKYIFFNCIHAGIGLMPNRRQAIFWTNDGLAWLKL